MKSKLTYHRMAQGSPEWHALRTDPPKYTGSNAHKLLGTLDVKEYAKAVMNDFNGNYWTKRGHILEDEAIALYKAIHDVEIDRPGAVTNSDYPLCLYSPDGLLEDTVLEVKCFDLPKHKKLMKRDIPIEVLAQIHFGMLITERPQAVLIAYNPSRDEEGKPLLAPKHQFVTIKIKRNPAIHRNLKRIIRKVEEAHGL